MLNTFGAKNKFGKSTHFIKVSPTLQITIYEANDDNIIIELIEKGFFKNKIFFSHIIQKSFRESVIEAIDTSYAVLIQEGVGVYELKWDNLKANALRGI